MDARHDLLRLNVSGLSRSSLRKGGTDQPHHATSEGAMRVGAVLFGIGAIREEAQRGLVQPRNFVRRRARRSGLRSIPERIGLGAMNIRTIVLVILGLVLVSAIVLSTTALASVLILGGEFHWKRVVVSAAFWLLVLGCIAATMYRGGVKKRTPGSHHP